MYSICEKSIPRLLTLNALFPRHCGSSSVFLFCIKWCCFSRRFRGVAMVTKKMIVKKSFFLDCSSNQFRLFLTTRCQFPTITRKNQSRFLLFLRIPNELRRSEYPSTLEYCTDRLKLSAGGITNLRILRLLPILLPPRVDARSTKGITVSRRF